MSGKIKADLKSELAEAVAHYWVTRKNQQERQKKAGVADQGARSAVTGGAQMDGFIKLLTRLIVQAGMNKKHIHHQKALELPGFFRPTKEWDLLVIANQTLVAAIEAKSQVGPSFGNNFNNRTEEAMGSALDLWTAYREGAFNKGSQPWLGYIFMLEDCPGSKTPVRVQEPHFKVFPEFANASYGKRYELFCRKLVRERHYTASSFLTSSRDTGEQGVHSEPADDLTFASFTRSLAAHIAAQATSP